MRPPKSTRTGMATSVVATTNVVKTIGDDDNRRHGEYGPVKSDTVGDRILIIISRLPGEESGRKAADMLGCSPDTLNGYTRGRTHPSFRVLEKLHRLTGVNLHWLICNEGNPDDGAPGGTIKWPSSPEAGMEELTKRRTKLHPHSKTMRSTTAHTLAPKKRS